MKLKQKPKEPKRKTKIEKKIWIYDFANLAEILERIPENVDYRDVRLETDNDYYEYNAFLVWVENETEEAFAKRLESYEKSLAEYNEWYEKNKEEIEKELSNRKNSAKKKRKKQAEDIKKKITALKKELEILEGK